jgi:hypothetical protein
MIKMFLSRKVLLSLLILWTASAASGLADCHFKHGQHVVLYSTADDPSVLMWDSRARLREYHAASFDEAQAMLPHALLVSPGTHADVMVCVPGYVVSPLFQTPDDAVGILITSGSLRGVARWVLGSDVRLTHLTAHR